MNRTLGSWLLVAGMLAAGSAQASGFVTARGSVLGGTYEFQCCGAPPADKEDALGAGVGVGLGVGRFFADVSAEFQDVNVFDRTDFLLTGGAFIGDRWSAFGGYRFGMFGDGFANDDFFREVGPFVGGGVSFRLGSRVSLGTSLAYNFVELTDETGASLDVEADGFSLKLQASILETPHSVFLRAQFFDGEDDSGAFEYEETYLQLGYQLTFEIATW